MRMRTRVTRSWTRSIPEICSHTKSARLRAKDADCTTRALTIAVPQDRLVRTGKTRCYSARRARFLCILNLIACSFIEKPQRVSAIEAKQVCVRVGLIEDGVPQDLRREHAVGDAVSAVAEREQAAGMRRRGSDIWQSIAGCGEGASPGELRLDPGTGTEPGELVQ